MDQHSLDNWVEIKETFEESGNTDNMFYQRACMIVNSGVDPLAEMLKIEELVDNPKKE